ncbi:MAG: hypothetical protein AB7L76_05530 [Burkholderiaceae bacterium]
MREVIQSFGARIVYSDHVAQAASGGLAAQRTITDITNGASTDLAWLRFAELAATFGWKSAATAAFVRELAKRGAHQ